MKKLVLISIIKCFIIGSVHAQEAAFSVILNKGENTFGAGTTFSQVLSGASLSNDDVIKIIDSGYVALVHEATGSSLELKNEGVFSVREMEQMILEQPSTVLAKYGKFLLKKLNPVDVGNQNFKVTGAVERGEEELIVVYWPSITDVYENEVIIIWQQTDSTDEYIVTVKNMFDELMGKYMVKGITFTLEMDNGKWKEESLLLINVRAKENEGVCSIDYGIKRVSTEVRKSLGLEFENIMKVANEESALNKLLIATFFEKNHLLVDAIKYYNQALVISPDPDGFNKLYENFLSRNSLK